MKTTTKTAAASPVQAAALHDAESVDPVPSNVSDLLGWLARRALRDCEATQLDRLTIEMADHASGIARRASAAASGTACLIGNEVLSRCPAGNFQQPADVMDLLLHCSDLFELVAGLVDIGAEANALLGSRGAR